MQLWQQLCSCAACALPGCTFCPLIWAPLPATIPPRAGCATHLNAPCTLRAPPLLQALGWLALLLPTHEALRGEGAWGQWAPRWLALCQVGP